MVLLLTGACGGATPATSATPVVGDAGSPNEPDARADGGAPGPEASADAGQLRPDVAPGTNFDLSSWELQEPIGAAGAVTTVGPAALKAGFQDAYFFTDRVDGAMTFWDPENGVITPNSSYPRSELRELNANGSLANWEVAGAIKHTLSATVRVTQVPDHVCVGQIHIGEAIDATLPRSTKPLLELYYFKSGDIKLGIEKDATAGGQTSYPITNVPLGTKFEYVLQLAGDGTITLVLDGNARTFAMPPSFAGYGEYFKAGNYDQTVGTDPTIGATVKFYALDVSHKP